ncbi:unnamed protein product [Mycena citricolor]|uniref:Heme haloperoxidase family profile domain-containing protein n=1 Tax=Mycena citricolor TaxID=2018698 RepID=A0AAD2HYS6_9AGAR|nr:unnamed protein product [Mycena citricolor]
MWKPPALLVVAARGTASGAQAVPGPAPIDVSGAHAFHPPVPGDFRGPCPALNALANHGYIPRSGYAGVSQAISASFDVFGMGREIAVASGLWGVIYRGDLAGIPDFRFSIGQPPGFGGVCSGSERLRASDGTHNQFEHDASVTRCDLYECVNTTAYLALEAVFARNPDRRGYIDAVFEHLEARIQHGIKNNAKFFYGPVQAIFAAAQHLLIPRLLSNGTTETLTIDNLRSLFGIIPDASGALQPSQGGERIPENWYPRATPYTAVPLLQDLIVGWTRRPNTLCIGGNTSETDKFALLDLCDLTGGVYDTSLLLQGSNAACFLFQLVQPLIPGNINLLDAFLATTLGLTVLSPACPELENIKYEMLEMYPGYSS